MKLNPSSILPSNEVLLQCRAGLTKHIRKTKSELTHTRDKDIRKVFHDKIYRLKVIRKEIEFLIREL